jgi:hypothetical protein
MKKMRTTLVAGLGLLLSACATPGGTVSDELETPRYTLVDQADDGRFELRRYEPYVVAATTVRGEFDAASREGFRIIAGYIFGKNQPRAQVAMTAPVSAAPAVDDAGAKIAMTAPVSARGNADGWRITFMMPSEYTLSSLPRPDDARVSLEEQPARCVASVRFSGFTTRASIEKQTEALRAWMKARGWSSDATPSVERYNDPFTLPWRRRNEVHVALPEGACPAPTASSTSA